MPPSEGKEPGVSKMAESLVANGLLSQLGIESAQSIQPPPYHPVRDPLTGVRNIQSLRQYTFRLAEVVQDKIAMDQFLLVLGGDCSILLGALLGERRTGSIGLILLTGMMIFRPHKPRPPAVPRAWIWPWPRGMGRAS